MKDKKLAIIIIIAGMLYAAIFAVVKLITIFQPYTIYNNLDLIAGNSDGSANKTNYRISTQDGITTVSCKKMTGMDTIWKYQANEDMTLQMHYNLNVTSGRAKLVLITPDNAIITLAEQDSTTEQNNSVYQNSTSEPGSSTFHENAAEQDNSAFQDNTGQESGIAAESTAELNLKKGKNRIRIVCEKGTAFSLSFSISV